MPLIVLETIIDAPVEICFDLSRSIDLHTQSMQHTNEKAIAGKTAGLIDLNETVTWKAKHFGITWTLSSKITQYNRPHHFRDEMVDGIFKSFIHDHFFVESGSTTIMTDHFNYTSPFGGLGKLANQILIHAYMQKLLNQRNECIKLVAANQQWNKILPQ